MSESMSAHVTITFALISELKPKERHHLHRVYLQMFIGIEDNANIHLPSFFLSIKQGTSL